MKDSYKKSGKQIQVPSDLLQSTAKQMEQALEIPAEDIALSFPTPAPEPVQLAAPKKEGRVLRFGVRALMFAAAIAIVFTTLFPRSSGIAIKDTLVAGQHQSQVALSQGELHFEVPPPENLLERPTFGLRYDPSSWSLEEYQAYVGDTPLPPAELPGLTLVSEEISLLYDNQKQVRGDQLVRIYEGKAGEVLTVTGSKSKVFSPAYQAEHFTSLIGETPVGLVWDKKNDTYTAEFSTPDYSLTYESYRMTQEEFVKTLLQFSF